MPEACSRLEAAISADDVRDLFNAGHDLAQYLAGFIDELRALDHLADRILDQRLDLLGRLGAAGCQVAHFGGDDRKTAALFAGARRFDRGIERQQIRLKRDLVDHADDVGDLLARPR